MKRDYPYAQDGRNDPQPDGPRVVRGGSFADDHRYARCAFRLWGVPVYFNWDLGLRVVVAPVSPL